MKYLKKTALALLLTQNFLFAQGTLIPYISETNATGEVKTIYEEVKNTFGMIPAPIMQHSISPELLKNHWDLFRTTGKNNNFSPKFLAKMLKHMFHMSDEELKDIQKDPSHAKLTPKEQKMLLFLLTATKDPLSLQKDSFDELRNLGWNDKDIFEGLKMATQMVAAIYMVNALKIPSDFREVK